MNHKTGFEAGIEASGMGGWDHIEDRINDFMAAYLKESGSVIVPSSYTKVAAESGIHEMVWSGIIRHFKKANPFNSKVSL